MVNVYVHNIGGIKAKEVDNLIADVDKQIEKNIDFIIILEGRLHLCKQELNARLTNYKAIISWYNINVFARKDLNPTVLVGSREVNSFINGNAIVTTFYLTPFHKSRLECSELIDSFMLHLKSIVNKYPTHGHILLGDFNIPIEPNVVLVHAQFKSYYYGIQNRRKVFGFLEVNEYKAVHKFPNGYDNFIDVILVRGEIIVESQKAIANQDEQILPQKLFRDHRRVVITYTATPQEMQTTKRKRATEAEASGQREVAMPPIAGSAPALLLNLSQTQKTTAAAMQNEHEQRHKNYMASHERMTRLLNINAEFTDVIMEQAQNEIAPEMRRTTELRAILHSETVVRQSGGDLVESRTTTHHYTQVFEVMFSQQFQSIPESPKVNLNSNFDSDSTLPYSFACIGFAVTCVCSAVRYFH